MTLKLERVWAIAGVTCSTPFPSNSTRFGQYLWPICPLPAVKSEIRKHEHFTREVNTLYEFFPPAASNKRITVMLHQSRKI